MRHQLSKKALKATNDAITILGGNTAVGDAFGFCDEAVRKWRHNGVPLKHVAEFVRLANTKGVPATCHAIRPDAFPEGV